MYFCARSRLALPFGIDTVGTMPIAPSLGYEAATGTPLAAAAPVRSVYHTARAMSPRSKSGMIWSGCVYIIWTFGLSFLMASKPGSMFSTDPPLSRAAAIRNCWPDVPEMSGMTSFPFHSGFQRSAHDVGGDFTRFVLYVMMVPANIIETQYPSLSRETS